MGLPANKLQLRPRDVTAWFNVHTFIKPKCPGLLTDGGCVWGGQEVERAAALI